MIIKIYGINTKTYKQEETGSIAFDEKTGEVKAIGSGLSLANDLLDGVNMDNTNSVKSALEKASGHNGSYMYVDIV